MNSMEADRQIQQMIAFIQQEAAEKAEEIRVKTESAFMAEKLSLQTQASIKIREEFEKKKKDRLVQKKIERSKEVATLRVKSMEAREERIRETKNLVLEKLSDVAKNPQYPELIKFLLVQALLTISEDNISVQCREVDKKIVESQLPIAVKEAQATVKEITGADPVMNATISTEWLPPPPKKGSQGLSCCGGVVLSAKQNKIICRNTLDARLDIAFELLKPQVRGLLFGVRAAPANAFDPSKQKKAHH